jgi:hypothetical protein
LLIESPISSPAPHVEHGARHHAPWCAFAILGDSVKRSNVVDASCVCCSVVFVVSIKCVVSVSADIHLVKMIFGLIGDIRRIGVSKLVNLILL